MAPLPASLLVVVAVLCIGTLSTCGSARKTNVMPTFAGPYIVYMERFYSCDGVETDDASWVRCPHFGHFNPLRPFDHQLVSCNLSLSRTFDDSFWGESRVASWSNNQWKANALVFRFPGEICSNARRHAPDIFRALIGNAVSSKGPCQAPAGEYFFNRTIDWTFPYFPILPYGRYRCQLKVGSPNAKTPHFCMNLEGRCIPRPTQPGAQDGR